MMVAATALLLTTGWGQAAAATVTQVFVTNTTKNPVPVTGSVSTRPATSTPWVNRVPASAGSYTELFAPPPGKTTLALTSLTSANFSTGMVEVQLYRFFGSACTGTVVVVDDVAVPPTATVHQDFPQPIVIAPGGSSWSLCIEIPPGNGATLTAVGDYY